MPQSLPSRRGASAYCSIAAYCSILLLASLLSAHHTHCTFDCTARGMRARANELHLHCIQVLLGVCTAVFCRVVPFSAPQCVVCVVSCRVVSRRAVEISLRAERAPLLRAAPPPPQFFDSKLNSTHSIGIEFNRIHRIANSLRSF